MKLLCQLWALNESLQDYKKTLEDEENQREVASILESHLEEEDEEDELTANDNEESSWQEDLDTTPPASAIASANDDDVTNSQGKNKLFIIKFHDMAII